MQAQKKKQVQQEEEDSQMEQHEEIEEDGPLPIGALEDKGIARGDIKKLQEAGYRTVEAIAFQPKKIILSFKFYRNI